MSTIVLVRHGRTSANERGILAGRSPGVTLDEVGQEQATTLATRLSTVPFATIVTSPLERTRETAAHIHGQQDDITSDVVVDERFIECDYGTWTGQSLATLAKKPLWKQVQSHPSAVTFPDGESLMAMSMRAVAAIREWNQQVSESDVLAVVSHGDVIKAVLADALGMHLDAFQRLTIDPCSVSIVRYTKVRPFVVRINDTGSDVAFLASKDSDVSTDAPVGGGAGRG
ncbi:MAG: MSMEG_4193 family putative phosphomutase [Actinomycetales bacterium]|nr:MSMEG_4193 family putative phosphomutase [Actinomycetales bacterium]MCP4893768.1 MSMEG_4193 family putative phosphomutase [Actinomycetales bacterium]